MVFFVSDSSSDRRNVNWPFWYRFYKHPSTYEKDPVLVIINGRIQDDQGFFFLAVISLYYFVSENNLLILLQIQLATTIFLLRWQFSLSLFHQHGWCHWCACKWKSTASSRNKTWFQNGWSNAKKGIERIFYEIIQHHHLEIPKDWRELKKLQDNLWKVWWVRIFQVTAFVQIN